MKWDAKIRFTGTLWSNPTVIKEVRLAMKSTAKYAKETVRKATPVDTGLMESSYKVLHGERSLKIQNDAPYSGHVEYGTSKMEARAPVRKSLPAIVAYFRQDVGDRIEAKGSTKSRSQKALLDRTPATIIRPQHRYPRPL